jgi:predicted MFS family arabinose efflux permease
LSTLLYGASIGFYQYILPLYMSSLGATPDQVGFGLALGNSGSIVGLLVGGALVNRFELRLQIIISWALTCLSGVMFVVAWSWQTAAFALFLSAVSLIGIPAYNAYIVLAREEQSTTEALTIVYAGFTAGTAITPALGGWIIAAAGMQAMFVASLACVVASTVVVFPMTQRWAGDAEDHSATPRSSRFGRLAGPIQSYGDSLNSIPFRQLLALLSVVYITTYVGVSLLPNFLQDRLGMDPSTVNVLGTGAAIVGVIGSLGLARLVGRIGQYRALALSELLLCAGFGVILAAPTLGSLAGAAGAVGFALRGGVQAQSAVARAMVAAVADGPRMGPSFALQSVSFNLALTVGPALAGLFYTSDPGLPLWIALGVGVPIVVYLAAQPRARSSDQRKQSTV